MTDDQRLRRQLRAQALVNRQLHAQLAEANAELGRQDGTRRGGPARPLSTARVVWRRVAPMLPARVAPVVERKLRAAAGVPPAAAGRPRRPSKRSAARSAAAAADWLDELDGAGVPESVSLARRADGAVFLVEDTQQRRVVHGLLGALLEAEMGAARSITDDELDELDEGPPVELFVAASGSPFVIVGGERRPINGYPLPHPVEDDQADRFDEGEPLRIARIRRESPAAAGEQGRSRLHRLRGRWPG